MKVLSVRQPWAWAIAHGRKDVENRSWPTQWHGRLAVHASARWDEDGAYSRQVIKALLEHGQPERHFDPPLRVEGYQPGGVPAALLADPRRFVPGAVIAVARLVDVCTAMQGCNCGPWAVEGQCHWRLASVQPLAEPVPCKGRLGLWDLPDDAEAAVVSQLAAAEQSGEAS